MMNLRTPSYQRSADRQAEGEGFLRILILAFALALPLATMAWLKIQETRVSYEMSKLKAQLQEQEEVTRVLQLERSRLRRDEEIQKFATEKGLVPRKQAHLIHRAFTQRDQQLAKNFGPIASDALLPIR